MRRCDVPAGCVAAKYLGRVATCCGLAVVVARGQCANGFIGVWREVDSNGDGLFGSQERRLGDGAHRSELVLQTPPDEPGDQLSVLFAGDALLSRDRPGLEPGQSLVT